MRHIVARQESRTTNALSHNTFRGNLHLGLCHLEAQLVREATDRESGLEANGIEIHLYRRSVVKCEVARLRSDVPLS